MHRPHRRSDCSPVSRAGPPPAPTRNCTSDVPCCRRLQDAYECVIFQDYAFAQANCLEDRMWNRFHRIIEEYRKNLTQFKELHGRKRPVELRKLQDAFVGFIKQTTRFYRSLVQRLISHFQLRELEWVVTKFHLTSMPRRASVSARLADDPDSE